MGQWVMYPWDRYNLNAVFDEAHYSQSNKPRGAEILMEHGYTEPGTANDKTSVCICPLVKAVTSLSTSQSNNLIVRLSHPEAIIPKQASTKAAGYDLYSVQDCTILPNCVAHVNTGIKIQLPHYTYGHIASRSGLVVHHQIHTEGGVIDPGYTGEIQVILHNFGPKEYTVKCGDRIAQLILERYESPTILTSDDIAQTDRENNGFGSTGINSVVCNSVTKSL